MSSFGQRLKRIEDQVGGAALDAAREQAKQAARDTSGPRVGIYRGEIPPPMSSGGRWALLLPDNGRETVPNEKRVNPDSDLWNEP